MADYWDMENVSTATTTVTDVTLTDAITSSVTDVTLTDAAVTSETIMTLLPSIATTVAPDNTTFPAYVGYICAAVAVLTFGSNFIPVKKFETGDGMFFQWMLCAGILLPAIVLQAVRAAKFYPIVMLGGFLWSTGNICVVPIIKTIGMGLGLCIWGMFNLLAGWASGRFGMFGIKAEVPGHVTLNYIGVALAVLSSGIYVMIKTELKTPSVEMTVNSDEENAPLLGGKSSVNQYDGSERRRSLNASPHSSIDSSHLIFKQQQGTEGFSLESLSPTRKRVVGVGLSLVSGLLYGVQFVPAIYVQDNYKGASQESLDYVFAHFVGIFLTGSFYFISYAVIMKNNPVVYPKVILPAILSGVMWAIATGCWFIANKALSEPVAFPIITTGPGVVASLFWGVVVFKEVQGKRNILLLLLAFAVTATGAILAGVSKA